MNGCVRRYIHTGISRSVTTLILSSEFEVVKFPLNQGHPFVSARGVWSEN
jgi:hypothetical protein